MYTWIDMLVGLYRRTVDALLIFVCIFEVREQAHPAPPPPWKTKREKEKKNWKGLTAFSVISALFKTVKLTYFKSDQFQLRLAPKKPTPPPPGTVFFSPGWQIRRAGDSWAVKSFGGGGGTKKEGKSTAICQQCNIFHCLHSWIVPFWAF